MNPFTPTLAKTIGKALVIISLGVPGTLCHADNETTTTATNTHESAVITNSTISKESQAYYRKMAKDYQTKADYYNHLLGNESAAPKYNPFKGTQLSFGGGSSTGNNSTSNAQGNLIINYKPSESDVGWNFNTLGQYDYLYSDSDGVQKNRLYLQQNGYYMFNKYNGMFAQASYLNDVPNGYDYIWNENIGYQLQLFKTKRQNLVLSLGPGLQQQQTVAPDATIQSRPSWLTQATYNLNINDSITFTEQLQNVATGLNTSTYSISAITIQAYKNIGIGLNYQFTYNSVPEPNTAALSTITAITFVYSLN